jgi:uncharacterized protein YcfL
MIPQIRFSDVVLMSLGLSLLAGCSSLEVTNYDREKNIVFVRTAELDSKSAATTEAQEYCASKVTLLNPDQKADAKGITVYQFTCNR